MKKENEMKKGMGVIVELNDSRPLLYFNNSQQVRGLRPAIGREHGLELIRRLGRCV